MKMSGLDTGEQQPYEDRHNTAVDKDRLQRIQAPRFEDGAEEIRENPFDQPDDVTHLTAPAMPRIPNMGDHIGNDHQAPIFQPIERFRAPEEMPRRPLIHPYVAEHGIPSFGTGLNWVASVQSPVRSDLVNFDWGQGNPVAGHEVSNIELRTIYAHLLETAGRIRAEMRERQMQVDL